MKSTSTNDSKSSDMEAAKEKAAKAYSEADDAYKKALAFFNEPLVWNELVKQAALNWNNDTYELFAVIQKIINLTKSINSSDGDIQKKVANKIELQKILKQLQYDIKAEVYNVGSGARTIIQNFNPNDPDIITKMESVITTAEGGGQAVSKIVGENQNSSGPPNPIFVDIKNRAEQLKAKPVKTMPKEITPKAEAMPKETPSSYQTSDAKKTIPKAGEPKPPLKRTNSWLEKAKNSFKKSSQTKSPEQTLEIVRQDITALKTQLKSPEHSDKVYGMMGSIVKTLHKDLEKCKHLPDYVRLKSDLELISKAINLDQKTMQAKKQETHITRQKHQ